MSIESLFDGYDPKTCLPVDSTIASHLINPVWVTESKHIQIGMIFGRRTVISEPFSIRVYSGYLEYRVVVRCECGEENVVRCKRYLEQAKKGRKNGKQDGDESVYPHSHCKSCGSKRTSDDDVTAMLRKYLNEIKRKAAERELPFELTNEKAMSMFRQDCEHCGIPPSTRIQQARKSLVTSGKNYVNGIDRIDSSKGYTPENSVTCCKESLLSKLAALHRWDPCGY